MANYLAVAAVCDAVIRLLQMNRHAGLFDGKELEFKTYTTEDFAMPMQHGVSLFLYRVGPNKVVRTPAGRSGREGRSGKPSLPLDLHFLLTVWARDSGLQASIVGWMMRLLADQPILTASHLNAVWPGAFAPDESVEILLDEMNVQEMSNLWDRLPGQQYRLSIPYCVRAVALDPMSSGGASER